MDKTTIFCNAEDCESLREITNEDLEELDREKAPSLAKGICGRDEIMIDGSGSPGAVPHCGSWWEKED